MSGLGNATSNCYALTDICAKCAGKHVKKKRAALQPKLELAPPSERSFSVFPEKEDGAGEKRKTTKDSQIYNKSFPTRPGGRGHARYIQSAQHMN